MRQLADTYNDATAAAMKYARPADDQWSTRYINGLALNGLCLSETMPVKDYALYPSGLPAYAPRPPEPYDDDERDWSEKAVIVWDVTPLTGN